MKKHSRSHVKKTEVLAGQLYQRPGPQDAVQTDQSAEVDAAPELYAMHIEGLNGRQRINAALECQKVQGNRYVQFKAETGRRPHLDDESALKLKECTGRGETLPANILKRAEQSLRHDLSGVRLHTDSATDEIVRSTGADAFTLGQDIFLKQGAYDPASDKGAGLLGHELAHTVQQDSEKQVTGSIEPSAEIVLENEADQAARAMLDGQPFAISGAAQGQVQFGDDMLTSAWNTVAGWFGAGEEEGGNRGVNAEPGSAEYQEQVAEALLTAVEEVLGNPLSEEVINAMRDPEYVSQLRLARFNLSHVPFSLDWIRRAWNINARGTDILEVADALHNWSQVDAMSDPQGYAREAGRALSALGRLGQHAMPGRLGMAAGVFDWLSRCDTFFTDILRTIDPAAIYQRSGEYRGLSRSDRSEIWTLQD